MSLNNLHFRQPEEKKNPLRLVLTAEFGELSLLFIIIIIIIIISVDMFQVSLIQVFHVFNVYLTSQDSSLTAVKCPTFPID